MGCYTDTVLNRAEMFSSVLAVLSWFILMPVRGVKFSQGVLINVALCSDKVVFTV